MNAGLKTILLILFFCVDDSLCAQNLTGDGNGYLTQNGKACESFHGNLLTGFARYTTNTGAYARHEFRGEVLDNKVKITETKVIEDGGRGTWNWCIKILDGLLKRNGYEYIIEGTWSNDGNRGFSGGVHTNSGSFNCPPGRFRVTFRVLA